ncbi:hypothetical protein ACFX5Q_34820, partial [Mesorhizobium sp. IMUNJ 23033]|uniref:hypothetical protein n=1 Tax=Mesorhizobium sp. IMUNJ 23033 TaxID=3378039 RepID=UPI003850B61F
LHRSQPHAGMGTPGVYPASSHAGITNYIKDRNAFDFISAHQRPTVVIFSMERSFFFVAFQHDHVRHLMPFEKGRSTSSASGRLGREGERSGQHPCLSTADVMTAPAGCLQPAMREVQI